MMQNLSLKKLTDELSFVTREKLNEVHRTARLRTALTPRCELSDEQWPSVGQKLLGPDTVEVGSGSCFSRFTEFGYRDQAQT